METQSIEFVEKMLQSIIAFFRQIAVDQKARKLDLWQWATSQYAPDAYGRSIFALEFGYRLMADGDAQDNWTTTFKPVAAIIKTGNKPIDDDFEWSLKSVFTHVYAGSFSFTPDSETVYDAFMVPMDELSELVEPEGDEQDE